MKLLKGVEFDSFKPIELDGIRINIWKKWQRVIK